MWLAWRPIYRLRRPRRRVGADRRLLHRRQRLQLVLAESGHAADSALAVGVAVHGDLVGKPLLHGGIEGVVGRAHVGECGVAAGLGHDPRRQCRTLGRGALEGAVGVPVVVALEQQPGLTVGGPECAVLPDVGEVDDRRVLLGVDLDDDALQRAEAFAEGDLRLFREMLAREDQDGVGVPCRLDGREGLVVERVQPHAAHRRAESGVCRCDVERHGPLLSRRLSLYHDHPEAIYILVEAGAGPRIRVENGRTPLHWVCFKRGRHHKACKVLTGAGADANAHDRLGWTASLRPTLNPCDKAWGGSIRSGTPQ